MLRKEKKSTHIFSIFLILHDTRIRENHVNFDILEIYEYPKSLQLYKSTTNYQFFHSRQSDTVRVKC